MTDPKSEKPWHEHFTSRFADPFLSSFLILFVVNQWQFFYVLFWSKYQVDITVLIATMVFSRRGMLVALAEAAFYTFAWPAIAVAIESTRSVTTIFVARFYARARRTLDVKKAIDDLDHTARMKRLTHSGDVFTRDEWKKDAEYKEAEQKIADMQEAQDQLHSARDNAEKNAARIASILRSTLLSAWYMPNVSKTGLSVAADERALEAPRFAMMTRRTTGPWYLIDRPTWKTGSKLVYVAARFDENQDIGIVICAENGLVPWPEGYENASRLIAKRDGTLMVAPLDAEATNTSDGFPQITRNGGRPEWGEVLIPANTAKPFPPL